MIYVSRTRAGYDPLPKRKPGTHAVELMTEPPNLTAVGVIDNGSQVRYSRDINTLARLRRGLTRA
jgi:hypothetical protein